MAAIAIRGPMGHEDQVSVVDHLDELRSRLIVCVAVLVVAFAACAWQNNVLLKVIGAPLAKTTEQRTLKGQGPLGGIYDAQHGVQQVGGTTLDALRALAAPASGLPASSRQAFERLAGRLNGQLRALPTTPPPNQPVTLGIGEPFTTTITVALYFALLLSLPILLYQLYAFILPAFAPEERRVAVPLMAMIPVLFAVGVVFGYFIVLPAATTFLQNFNASSFQVLVQAKDYYKFAVLCLVSMGLVFQLPVGILALTRLGVLSVKTLRKNRRYAWVILAVVAMVLPGTDPVSMLIELVPLLLLFEMSVFLARYFGKPVRSTAGTDPA